MLSTAALVQSALVLEPYHFPGCRQSVRTHEYCSKHRLLFVGGSHTPPASAGFTVEDEQEQQCSVRNEYIHTYIRGYTMQK